ncbi:WhiB family transcriptional regulator [Candidatus Saccharibacteria bacterium]|nr:WhiB family transcriptional regulator [Candidatus Saccharibacteria bacterium]
MLHHAGGGSWRDDILCNQVLHPDESFPERGGSTRMAKLVCAMCYVTPDCCDDVMRLPQGEDNHGIRAALSHQERKHKRKETMREQQNSNAIL